MMECAQRRKVTDYFADRLGLQGESVLRKHVSDCADCRALYRRHLLFSELSPGAVSPQARLKRGINFGGAPTRARRVRVFAFAFAMSAAAVICFLRVPATFVARGVAIANRNELDIYKVGAAGKPMPVTNAVAPNDEIGFVYRNPSNKKWLLIFAIDERGQIYWYEPAWVDAATDPKAIAVAGGKESHALSEVTAHTFVGNHLRLFAVFTDNPLSVKEVEANAKKDGTVNLRGTIKIERELDVTR